MFFLSDYYYYYIYIYIKNNNILIFKKLKQFHYKYLRFFILYRN